MTLNNDLDPSVTFAGITTGSSSASANNTNTAYTIDTLHFADGAQLSQTSNTDVAIYMTTSITADGELTFNHLPAIYASPSAGKNIDVSLTNLTYNNVPLGCGGYGGAGGGPSGGPSYTLNWQPTGIVTVGSGSYYTIRGTESAIIVKSGGLLSLPYSTSPVTYNGDITFEGGGSTQGSTCNGANTYLSLDAYSKSITLGGKITLAGGDIVYNVSYGNTLKITGTIDGRGSALKPYSGSTGTFINNAKSDNSDTAKGTVVVPVKTLPTITDNKPSDSLYVASKTIVTLDGVRGQVTVNGGATLKGNGTMKTLYVYDGGTVAPGHSPGKLTVLDTFTLYGGATYQVQLKNAKQGNYDQIVAGSSSSAFSPVSLGGSSVLPNLDVSLYKGYSMKAGDKFTIINNKSKKPVDGTFKGLPEGATFKVKDGVFKISYKGGDGNDVVLTVLNAPVTPDTGFAMITANPATTAIATILSAGAIALIAKKTKLTGAKR